MTQRGFISDEETQRIKELIDELMRNLDRKVVIKQDREQIRRYHKYLSEDFMFRRQLTKAEAENVVRIHANYVAYEKNRKRS